MADLVDDLQASGRYTFSIREALEGTGASKVAVRSALQRLKRKARVASPRREFYVIVPLEYRTIGCLPASSFVDDLMAFLAQPYYVALLSAAEIHGAAHQRPQVFQVMTDRPTSRMTAGRVRLEFVRKRRIEQVATTRVKTNSGYMTVATPSATVFDLVRHVRTSAGLDNVATVLAELGEVIAPEDLAEAAPVASLPEVQRAGYLLERVGHAPLADTLAEYLSDRRVRPAPLRPELSADGKPLEPRWRLVINDTVDPDVTYEPETELEHLP